MHVEGIKRIEIRPIFSFAVDRDMHLIYQYLAAYPILGLVQIAFTIWMLVDCYHRSVEQYWFWVILFFQPLGAFIYFFVVKAPNIRWLQGVSLFQRGPSLAELRYRVEQSPTLANHLAFAEALIRRQRYEEAIPHLEAGLKTEPDHGGLLYSLALCQVKQGKPGEALVHLDRLLKRDPRWNHYTALRLLIEARVQTGDKPGALESCRTLFRLDGTLQNACLLAEHLLDDGKTEEARELLDRSLTDYSWAPASSKWRNWTWARRARHLQKEAVSVHTPEN